MNFIFKMSNHLRGELQVNKNDMVKIQGHCFIAFYFTRGVISEHVADPDLTDGILLHNLPSLLTYDIRWDY